MNKYVKKIRNRIINGMARRLPEAIALDVYKRLSSRFGIDYVTASGVSGTISGVPNDFTMASYLQRHEYCPNIVKLITKRLLKNGRGTFIDIGANIGLITIPVARDSEAVIHAFEPEPTNFGFLRRNIDANLPGDRVTLHNVALVSRSGSVKLELSSDNFGDHRIRQGSKIATEKFNESDRKIVDVKGAALDSIVSVDALPRPIVVKMDTQGAELEVIRGGQRLFSAADYVLTEYCPYMLLRAGSDPAEFIDFARPFPYAAVVDDAPGAKVTLGSPDEVIATMLTIPQDGSAARHMDVLLARHPS